MYGFHGIKRYWKNSALTRELDEKSAEILRILLEGKGSLSPADITMKHDVIIFGAGPSLKKNIHELKKDKLE